MNIGTGDGADRGVDDLFLSRHEHPVPSVEALLSVHHSVRAELDFMWLQENFLHPVPPTAALEGARRAVRLELASSEESATTLGRPKMAGRPFAKTWIPLAAAALLAVFVGRGLLFPVGTADSPSSLLFAMPECAGPVERAFWADQDVISGVEADLAELEASAVFGYSASRHDEEPLDTLDEELDELATELENLSGVI